MIGVICLIFTIVLTLLGQLCQKKAALLAMKEQKNRSQYRFFLLIAVIFLGVALLSWLVVLTVLPLSIAYPILSLNFVMVALCSNWFFEEKITLINLLGVFFIICGVGLLAS